MFGKKNNNADFEYFTIYDTKVGVYKQPMLAINKHDILRQTEALFRDPQQTQNQLLTNAEDFQLFKIGEYTSRTGTITPCEPEHVANLHEIRTLVQRSIDSRMPPRDVNQVGISST